jgi:hypothetical protein
MSVDITPGYYEVKFDFSIGFGSWKVRFRAGEMIQYRDDYVCLVFHPLNGEWEVRSPPIQGVYTLRLSKYDAQYEQQKQVSVFLSSTESLSEAEATAKTKRPSDPLVFTGSLYEIADLCHTYISKGASEKVRASLTIIPHR